VRLVRDSQTAAQLSAALHVLIEHIGAEWLQVCDSRRLCVDVCACVCACVRACVCVFYIFYIFYIFSALGWVYDASVCARALLRAYAVGC
jgi:hypothetical protein